MKIFIVLDVDGHVLAVFDSEEKAEAERVYLDGLDVEDLGAPWNPLDETKVVQGELNRSFTGDLR